MKLISLKKTQMTVLFIILSIILSCGKDSDLLLDAVLTPDETSIEDKNENTKETTGEDFVIRTFTFEPTNDAYLQDSEGFNNLTIRLQENYRTSYLMFDLRAVNGPITNAVLQFSVVDDEGNGEITINKGVAQNWSEENLTLNNAPSIEKQLGRINKTYKVGNPENIPLDIANLKSEITTLIMIQKEGNDLAFASKEHPTTKGPKLIITYQAPKGSSPIEQQGNNQDNNQDNNQGNETNIPENAFYVTTNGSATNDGLSETTPWSIEHAFSTAMAGDVVYIKAGDYGNQQLLVNNIGTEENPIKFIGYTNDPGDLVSNEGSTFNYGDTLDPRKMPLLTGASPNGEGQGVAITIHSSYIYIENFQITKYKTGLFGKGNSCTYTNIITSLIGDYNPNHTYPTHTDNHFLNYSGLGIVIEGNNTELHNSIAINCGAQGITFKNGNGMKAFNNKVFSDNPINPTDYYFLISGGIINSSFKNTFVQRVGELRHLGHGIVVKGQDIITGNIIDGFEILNTYLEVQFPKTTNNIFKNGTITKQNNVDVNTKDVAGMRLANGAKSNLYENIVLTNCSIKFSDWNDGLPGDVNDTSDNNTFKNIHVKDAYSAIAFSHFLQTNHSSSADNNTFTNCTFSNIDYLFEVDRANTNTNLINCNINNVRNLKIKRIPNAPTYPLDSSYQNCQWSDVGFTPPN